MKREVDPHSVRRALNRGSGREALSLLKESNEALKRMFAEDPFMAVTGELFDIVRELDEYAQTLARLFQAQGEAELEEQAWQSRYDSVATAHLHRRNLLGPAMLDWAGCNKRLGNIAKADRIYDTIVHDFSEILGWGPTFDPDWLLAVHCLEEALENSSNDFGELKDRTQAVLAASERLVRERERARS